MSLPEFVLNVKTAAKFLSPTATTDHAPTPDYERTLELADIWLTPNAVRGFDPADFVFLTPDDREALARAVEAFRLVAGQVPADRPASPEQAAEALAPFLSILRLLSPYISDAEGQDVHKALWGVMQRHRTAIAGFDFRLGTDWSGREAVWVWIVLFEEPDFDRADHRANVARLRTTVEQALAEAGVSRWPYVTVRTRQEMRDLVQAGGAAG